MIPQVSQMWILVENCKIRSFLELFQPKICLSFYSILLIYSKKSKTDKFLPKFCSNFWPKLGFFSLSQTHYFVYSKIRNFRFEFLGEFHQPTSPNEIMSLAQRKKPQFWSKIRATFRQKCGSFAFFRIGLQTHLFSAVPFCRFMLESSTPNRQKGTAGN